MANEDFTTYTEVDAAGNITVIASKVSWNDLDRDEESYVYKDMGVNHFSGDFEHKFTVQHSDQVNQPISAWWLIANAVDDFKGLETASADFHVFYYLNGLTYLAVCENGSYTTDNYNSADSTDYYITLSRDDDGGANSTGQLVAEIRTGSHSGPLQDTLTVDCSAGEQNDFRYLYPCSAYNDGDVNKTWDGYTENLDLQEAAGLSIPIAMYHYMHHSSVLIPLMWAKQGKVTRREFLRNTGISLLGV